MMKMVLWADKHLESKAGERAWLHIIPNEDLVLELVAVVEWVARQTAKQEVGSSNPGIPPLLEHACGEGDWLLCWLYTLAEVSHQR